MNQATSDARSLADQIFAGSGELASLIRNIEWANTALGPIETWPQSLRTAVSICLGSRHPIVLWWGPDRWMFYNDGYRPMLGERKHPQFLGRPGQECWAEIWDIIGPMMGQVITTGEATWSENLFLLMLRSGYLEETYFTFSYSPIRDETGRPHGIFNACTETTGRVLGDRRMKALRELAVQARTVDEAVRSCAEILGRNARDVPFALVYLLDERADRLDLVARAGLEPGTLASPLAVDANAKPRDDAGWPLARVVDDGRPRIVDDLDRRFDCLPKEPWDESAHQAMVLPIARPGWHRPAGVLVLGISPRRAFDDDYRGFFDLVAGHVATAISSARAYEAERARAEQLAELDRVKTAFFSNVSHEFRTPLTLMIGPLEDSLADRADPPSPQQRMRLTLAYDNTLRLLKLVNALLDFSSLEVGRMRARFAPIDLAGFTAELAAMFQSAVDKSGIALVIDCPKLSTPAWVDRDLWEKIVPNLVSNAFKFTLAGEITVGVRDTDESFVLEVSDTGTGIPEEELPKIFDRFHRVPGATGRTHEGTGIGLSLVRELVELHGGSVSATSTLGRGTTFRVEIPKGYAHLPPESVSQTPSTTEPNRGVRAHVAEVARWVAGTAPEPERGAALQAATTPDSSRARVLVVDDNAELREYITGLLTPTYDVTTAIDGQAALDVIRAGAPDIILSDVMMPRLDGFALVRELRADPETASLPVILLSARAGEEAAVEGLDTGADDYLVKPFSARELLARVRTHVQLARARRAWIAELEAKNEELEAFAYSASHDLRAPLRTIDGFSQALAEDLGEKLDDRAEQQIRKVRAAASRMSNLIEDLLRLARVTRGELRRARVDLSSLAGEVTAQLRERDPTRVVVVRIADGLVVDGDPGLLRTAMENLIGNAWKFSSRRQEAVIEVGAAERDGKRAYFVRDNGVGFEREHADTLFRPFQRLHGDKEFEGTGIGLATVQRIIGRHGGRVWADGMRDAGATVFFQL